MILRSQARREVLQVLGLLACAREPLTLRELSQFFGREAADRMEDLLTVAADFFDGRPVGRTPDVPFRFFHSRFQEFILEGAADYLADLHAQLADACLRWRELDEPAHLYALCHLPAHLREVKRWEELIKLLSDLRFLKLTAKRLRSSARIERFLRVCLDQIPDELIAENQKISHMIANFRSFAACLQLSYAILGGEWDKEACCTSCGEYTINRGYIDLAAPESNYFWDNYFSWCVSCFWSWHYDRTQTAGYEDPEWKFNYTNNIYL